MPLFLLSAASPVLPALPPLTLLSLSAGKTLLNEADKDSAQPCHGAYEKLHLHVLGVCGFFFFNLRSVMSYTGNIK